MHSFNKKLLELTTFLNQFVNDTKDDGWYEYRSPENEDSAIPDEINFVSYDDNVLQNIYNKLFNRYSLELAVSENGFISMNIDCCSSDDFELCIDVHEFKLAVSKIEKLNKIPQSKKIKKLSI